MKIKIYQINLDKDENKHFCLSYDMVKDNGGIDLYTYDVVFEHNDFPQWSLDMIFEAFNTWDGNPYRHEFTGHSLSVSDIICIEDSKDKCLLDGYYFVNSFGFKDITGYCKGYWKCLNDIGYLIDEPQKTHKSEKTELIEVIFSKMFKNSLSLDSDDKVILNSLSVHSRDEFGCILEKVPFAIRIDIDDHIVVLPLGPKPSGCEDYLLTGTRVVDVQVTNCFAKSTNHFIID